MLIKKEVHVFRRYSKSWRNSRLKSNDKHIEEVREITWKFLFIPIFTSEQVLRTNTNLP